jgi:methylated-DNA-[protein]-cysteine S-methyltransferase
MSGKKQTELAELEQALRRGPVYARDDASNERSRARGEDQGGRTDETRATRAGTRRADARAAETELAARAAAERLSARVAAEGLAEISYAAVDSPFGRLLLAATDEGLVRLAFPEEDADGVLEGLARRISPRIVEAPAQLEQMRRELDEYFAARRRRFELRLDWTLVGPFGRRVLDAATAIPYGKVLSYAEVAAEAGSPRGSRAAGNALGANPIPIVVPCHRVLRGGGGLGGYAGGLERKRFLLELEGAL